MVITVLAGIALTIALPPNEASLPQPSVRGGPIERSSLTREEESATLDGRVLVVRVYPDWSGAPGAFEPLRVPVQGNHVTLEPEEGAVPPVVAVTPEDQEDPIVKKALGGTIWGQNLTTKLEVVPAFPRGPEPARPPWQFTDALGEPLTEAAVEIWLTDYRGPRVRLGRATLDDAGQLASRTTLGNLRTIYFVVSHPDYGRAWVREPFEPDRRVIVPLVRRGTLAAERAIRGWVVDPNGTPVVGATLDCPNVRTLGEGLIDGLGEVCQGLTDANGAFSFYLPNRKTRDDRGDLIPPKSQYHVRIKAPPALHLLPYAEPIGNGQETLVVLERGDRLRRLQFEDQNGPITDPARLQTIEVLLRRPGRNVLWLHYDDWKSGAPLLPGTYEASMRGPHGECALEYYDWLKPGVRQPVPVPAGVSLRLKVEMPYDEEFCPILIPQAICLRQGETADLGCFAFEPALAVQVRVVDSAGRVLEGIPVRTVEIHPDGTSWDVPHNTDEQGIARFHVVPNSTGSFGVLCHVSSGVSLQEMVDYRVGGPEDAGREFVLQLSDTMLAHLLQ